MNKHLLLIFLGILFYPILISAKSNVNDVERTGDVLMILIPTIAFSNICFFEENKEGAKQFIKALASTEIITEALKIITHKRRPNGSDYKSFPSGHTSTAFMGAGFIHKRYGLKKSIIPYIGASFVAFSRVYANRHYVEDVFAGAILGVLNSFYFTNKNNFLISLLPKKNTFNFSLNYNFN